MHEIFRKIAVKEIALGQRIENIFYSTSDVMHIANIGGNHVPRVLLKRRNWKVIISLRYELFSFIRICREIIQAACNIYTYY